MSDSVSYLDLIITSQASKELTANAMLDAMSPASLFGRRGQTTAGLTWGFYGGVILVGSTYTRKTNSTISLTDNSTNYLEVDTAGVLVKNTSGFTSGRIPCYKIIVAAGTVTSYEDWRPQMKI